ncbi:MAG: ferritin family protein [Dehalococcoidales bacterium]
MTTGQEKTTQALKYCIQMEIDGKEFYLKACRESSNELGKKLLKSLAQQEDFHRRKFEQIFEDIRKSRSWPVVNFKPDAGQVLKTIFAEAASGTASQTKAADTELEAVEKAMQMEDRSYDLYHQRYGEAAKGVERDFYETIAAEERGHKLILLDYYEYLKDPAAWYVKAEHHSLDG